MWPANIPLPPLVRDHELGCTPGAAETGARVDPRSHPYLSAMAATTIHPLLDALTNGERPDDAQVPAVAGIGDTGALMEAARAVRDRRSGSLVTYSPKVFIPLTELCRDVCRYCTFAKTPGQRPRAVSDGGRGDRDRAPRRRGRLYGGAVHAG